MNLGIFNDFGSHDPDTTDVYGPNHHLTYEEFFSLVQPYESDELSDDSYPEEDMNYTKQKLYQIFKQELQYQEKVNDLRCKLKIQYDFLSMLKALEFDPNKSTKTFQIYISNNL